jgi:hypothetical protein
VPARDGTLRFVRILQATLTGRIRMDRIVTRRNLLGGAGMVLLAAGPAAAATWVALDTRRVRLRRDHDRFVVGEERGVFDRLALRIEGNAVHLARAAVTFGNNETVWFELDVLVSPGTDGRSIDLPGTARAIRFVDLTYRRILGGGEAVVTLLGRRP